MSSQNPDTPIVNIVGEKVALGPLRRELVPLYQRWINDLSAARNVAVIPRPWTLDEETQWYEGHLDRSGVVGFTIYVVDGWRPIGSTALRDIDFRNRTAEFGILIGEAEARGRGYGAETTRLMLDYAFTALGLNNVMLRVRSYNLAGRRAYEKAGFKEFGRRRQAALLSGEWYDEILMDCLASEFESPVLRHIFRPDEPR